MTRFDRRSLLVALGGCALPVSAADPWEAKEPSQWTDKDIQRVLAESPWARQVSISMGSGMSGGGGGGGRGGRGGRGGGGGMSMPDASDSSGMGGGGMGGGGGMEGGGAPPSVMYTIRWLSALPIKQAMVKQRLGAEAETSPQAKAFLERKEEMYVVALIGPPMGGGGMSRGMGGPPVGNRLVESQGGQMPGQPGQSGRAPSPEEQKAWAAKAQEALKQAAHIGRKDKEDLKPAAAEMQSPGVWVFRFPKTDPITLDDKEVEFHAKLGPMEIKRKFKLKDMVYKGDLAL